MKSTTAKLWAKQDQHQGDRWRLFAAVAQAIEANALDAYRIPKKPQLITADTLRGRGRGIGYTKWPFAYLFTRVA